VDGDFYNFTVWYARRFPDPDLTEADEKLFLDLVLDSVRIDVEDPKFHTQLQEIAAEVREVLKTLAVQYREQRLQNPVAEFPGQHQRNQLQDHEV
jgi:hypothetical protein